MAEKEFEMKMARMELEQEKLRINLEEQMEFGSEGSCVSSHSKTAKWVESQQCTRIAGSVHSEPARHVSPCDTQHTTATENPVEKVERRKGKPPNSQEPAQMGNLATVGQIASRQVFPKKLPIFRGSPKEWPIFISCYNESTAACGFTDRENLMRLEECLQGAAREAVASKLTTPKSVPYIIKTLQRLYGRPALILNELIQKARQTEAPKPENLDSLIMYGIAVQHFCDHLVSANLENHLKNPTLLEELVEKLPASRRLEWAQFMERFDDPGLKEFGEFMDDLLEKACKVSKFYPKGKHLENAHEKPHRSHHIHDEQTASNESPSNRYQERPCHVCNKSGHRVRSCEMFRKMSVKDRQLAVNQHQLCNLCLNQHGSRRCFSRFNCIVNGCNARHNALLHPAKTSAEPTANKGECLNHKTPESETKGPDLARRLGVHGDPRPLKLRWTGGVTRKEDESELVNVQISARDDERRYGLFGAHTVQKLSLPRLIGLQHMDLMTPLETRKGQPNEPVAVRSPLGWAVYGPLHATNFMLHHNEPEGPSESDCECELNALLKRQFALEEVSISNSALPEASEIARAKEILQNTTVRLGCRFETGLLWRTDEIHFPNSFPMAVKRLQSLERKLEKTPELAKNVHQQIQEYLDKGYAHKATE
uniref:CCHC-type domain-containing protein n=1 Tax=Anopheles minimus TaxID=112268 RepID=A0A182W802_9DIPT